MLDTVTLFIILQECINAKCIVVQESSHLETDIHHSYVLLVLVISNIAIVSGWLVHYE